ncbi:conserved hypothetical protein [Paenibacillus curdlanolyticus YK9]|uniref:DUF3905 domain-containing protein n=1 Tax=Paenibacillus curdlanolyticus YK9 TaxID=717606 RepID=E0I7I2_9BACL|nr:DUF3905 domain-containing protein [Paenibacillus curdlanolyticus]EFM11998.1 conserved hypothetical protein [Paenibacillus curdlanolyticus YK9]
MCAARYDDRDEERYEQLYGNHDDPALDPYEINFLPAFRKGRGSRAPFINSHGIVIGDHMYASADSPLEQWSVETDPSIMAGDEWVHPYKDIGFLTADNRAIFEEGEQLQQGIFMHPDKDVGYAADEPLQERSPKE